MIRFSIKHFSFRKIILTILLMVILQNGIITVHDFESDTSSFPSENTVTPYSDRPPTDGRYN